MDIGGATYDALAYLTVAAAGAGKQWSDARRPDDNAFHAEITYTPSDDRTLPRLTASPLVAVS